MRAYRCWMLPLVRVWLLVAGWGQIVWGQDALETPQQRARYDKIVNEFIQYDVGQLRGKKGRAANARFQSLKNPNAIPALVRGAINASRIRASCPIIMISNKLGGLLRTTNDPRLLQHAMDYLEPTGPEAVYGTYLNNLRQIANEQFEEVTGREPEVSTTNAIAAPIPSSTSAWYGALESRGGGRHSGSSSSVWTVQPGTTNE